MLTNLLVALNANEFATYRERVRYNWMVIEYQLNLSLFLALTELQTFEASL